MKIIVLIILIAFAHQGQAAGAVVGEPGSCIIEIGIYTAHFTIYQPDSQGNSEFCEDLPSAGKTLFVMDYLHGSLGEVPLEFRIIRDIDNWGIFARWENVAGIEDIDARTVYYQAPTLSVNQLQVEVPFAEPGAYIGIVSAPHPELDKTYHAVFPFQVDRVDWAPWLLSAAVLLTAGAYLQRRRSLRAEQRPGIEL
jgi:hypothetical protein